MTPEEYSQKVVAMCGAVTRMNQRAAAMMFCHFVGALTAMHDMDTNPARILSALESAKEFVEKQGL